MIFLGIDLGTSSVKVSVVDREKQTTLASSTFPQEEAPIHSPRAGWAEQHPDDWWQYTCSAILACHATGAYDPNNIAGIGIAYQMHGLVMVDNRQQVIRPAIIWCDSRAVPYGNAAFEALGAGYCLPSLLNSPGNFTAAKLAWVKDQEPDNFARISKIMLPGDYIAMKLTGEITTTISALSEGVFWDFQKHQLAQPLLNFFGFDESIFPGIVPVFAEHGRTRPDVATQLRLRSGLPVTYKAGDQLNNALSLAVMAPGQLAATGGTSGVLYAVGDKYGYDPGSRINSFAHVSHTKEEPRIGTLLCINAAGIFYKWFKQQWATQRSYSEINSAAASVSAGSDGVLAIPFGNGAERMLSNRFTGASWLNVDLNTHGWQHVARATLEGIAFAFRYGFDIMRENGLQPSVIRAPRTNLFLSDVFAQSIADLTGLPIEFYEGDGSYGAALGASMGWNAAKGNKEGGQERSSESIILPADNAALDAQWLKWKELLRQQLEQ